MVSTLAPPPFQWLQELERRAKQKARGLPRQEKAQQIWRGIAFRLGTVFLVSALSDIREVLHCPTIIAKVPGSKPWVKGLANIRGQLLPVIDLQECLEGHTINIENRGVRLLVINQAGVSAGLLVDEVIGIKHFAEATKDVETPCKQAWLTPFARGLFHAEDAQWVIFDMYSLAESEQFLRAAS